MTFKNRRDGAGQLAELLTKYQNSDNVIILGLARGGVPVAHEIAQKLNVAFDVFLVRKIGVPGHEELAMGAIASGGARIINENVVSSMNIPDDRIEEVEERERTELRRREKEFRGGRELPELKGRTVILTDDGLATGASMRAAVSAVQKLGPERIVVAVPAASRDAVESISRIADDVVSVITPEPYISVGTWYQDFGQTSDDEVKSILSERKKTP